MKPLTHLVIHCSASPFGCATLIRKWHTAKGWKDIGYHFTVLNGFPWNSDEYLMSLDGRIEVGRFLDGDDMVEDNEVGAHTLGYNTNSIGICVIGKSSKVTSAPWFDGVVGQEMAAEGFTPWQLGNLATLCRDLMSRHNIPVSNVIGHYETASGKKEGKTCPDFDMSLFRQKFLTPYFTS